MRSIILSLLFSFGSAFFFAQSFSPETCERPHLIYKSNVFDQCIDYYRTKFNYRGALIMAEEGMRKHPYNYSLRLNKALLYETLGNSASAEKELIGLIKLYPEKQELHNYLGRMYYTQDRSKSLLALLKSISLDPDNDMSRENLIFVRRLLDGRPSVGDMAEQNHKLYAYKVDDFDNINVVLSRLSTQKQNATEDFKSRLSIFFGALTDYNHRKEGFFWSYYAPQFIDIYTHHNIDKFAEYITASQSNKEK